MNHPTVEELARRVELLEAALAAQGIRVGKPDRDDGIDYERAIRELAQGNRKPLSNYLKRGGKIPT